MAVTKHLKGGMNEIHVTIFNDYASLDGLYTYLYDDKKAIKWSFKFVSIFSAILFPSFFLISMLCYNERYFIFTNKKREKKKRMKGKYFSIEKRSVVCNGEVEFFFHFLAMDSFLYRCFTFLSSLNFHGMAIDRSLNELREFMNV